MRRALSLALVCAAAAIAAATVGAAVGKECSGIPTCVDVPGPWVSVPARGEAKFLLDCPYRRGIVAGYDVRASSRDVHVTVDALLGSPVSPGRSTTRYGFFRAVSGHHRIGLFQPLEGCVPASTTGRSTTAASAITPAGPPLDLAAALIPLKPGKVGRSTLGCANKEKLVYSWDATVFRTKLPPAPELASAITVERVEHGGLVTVTVQTSEALPPTAQAAVQVGVACTR